MRKIILLSLCLGLCFGAQAEITVVVTNPTNTTPNLAISYSSLASAITAINNINTMSGPVIFNLAAGTTETAPTGGYILGSAGLNVRTSATNTITFQKSGTGANPLITAFTPGTTTTSDGIWKIQGTDYVTINGIDLQENASNTYNQPLMEWGYAIVKLNATDGTKNISINNCAVTLNKNAASIGIYGGSVTAAGTLLTPTSATGINSNVKIQNCTIQNCYTPISMNGSSTLAYYDTGLEIGTTTGNTILNFGGSTTSTSGITVSNQNSLSIKNNSISSGTCKIGDLTGIDIRSCAGNQIISGNTIYTLSSEEGKVYGIYHSVTGSSTISKNKIFDLKSSYYSGRVHGLYINGGTSVNIYNNIIGNLETYNVNDEPSIPSLTGIYINNGTVNMYYNTINLNDPNASLTAAVYASTSANVDLRNNILVNTSTSYYSKVVAYQRSGTTLTTYANLSNNNLLYVNSPSTNRLLMFDGTNSYQTLADYKIAMGPTRDAATISENPVWLSTKGTDATYLTINPNRGTQIESGGSAITNYTDDFYGNIRNVSTPDIGAVEFNGIRPVINTPSPTSLSGFSTRMYSASAAQTFTVGGIFENDLIISAPTGYELRQKGTYYYYSTITFSPVLGVVSPKTIEVRIAANASAGLVSGNVICSSSGVANNQNVAVSGIVDELSLSSTSLTIGKSVNSYNYVNVYTDMTLTVTSDQSWLKVNLNGENIYCTAQSYNTTLTPRIATVTVIGTKNQQTETRTLTVTQAAGDLPYLSVTNNKLTIGSGKSIYQTLNVNTNLVWTATSDQDWLVLDTQLSGPTTLQYHTSTDNPLFVPRTAQITIKAPGVSDVIVTIEQALTMPTFSISGGSVLGKSVYSKATWTVNCNATWTATSDQSWLLVNSGATNGNGSLICIASENPTTSNRYANVKFYYGLTQIGQLAITQEAGDPVFLMQSTIVNWASFSGGVGSVDITSNCPFTATSNQSWLTATNNSASFSVGENTTLASRTGIITYKYGQIIKTATIIQAGCNYISTTVDKTANSKVVDLTSNADWTATSDQSWLMVTPSGLSGNSTLTLTAKANSSCVSRSAIVKISAKGAADKTIYVTQTAGDVAFVTLENAVNSYRDVYIPTNAAWSVTCDQSWLRIINRNLQGIIVNYYVGNLYLTFNSIEKNPLSTARTATVTFKCAGLEDKVVTVTQDAGDATLDISTSASDVSKGLNSMANITVTSNTSWTAISDQSWLAVNSGGVGNGTLTCTTVSANPTVSSRTAIVTLTTSGINGVVNKTITVTQAAGDPTLSVSATAATVAKSANSSGSIAFSSNVTWVASSNQNWLLVKSEGLGNSPLTFSTLSINPLPIAREALITIKAAGFADKIITVTQEAGDATLSVSVATASLAQTTNSSTNINVISNSIWTATSDQNWLSVTSGATGNATLTLTANTANPITVVRTALVTVKATGVADKTITVTQAVGDPTLSVSATTVSISKTANSTASVNVLSNTSWTAISDQSWLTVTSGATGNAPITLTATTANPFITSRSAIVTLKTAGIADKTITVTQSPGNAVLEIASATVTIDETINSNAYVDISSNVTWTATSNQSWLSVSSGAIGDAVLIITSTSANSTLTPRVATITLKAIGTTDKTITVTQKANTPVVTVDKNTVIISPLNNYSTSINVTSNTVWTASSDQNWLTITSDSNAITLSATASTVTRQSIVTISAEGVADTRIAVIQSPATANNYQFNMTVTSIATIDKLEITNNKVQLYAFIGDECRGTATLEYEESSKRHMAFLMVWGNADDVNKIITFKSYDPISTKEMLATNCTLKFLPENIIGSTTTPYSIDFVDKTTNTDIKQLILKVYLEGLWNGTNMNKCKEYDVILGDVVDKFAGSVVDTLSVELHNATYSNIAYRITGLQLNQDGTVHSVGKPYIEVPDAASGDYHITIRTRNHLETTSRSLVSFSGSTVTYDFTDAVTKAFESDASFTPMKQINGKWMLYSGNPLPMDPPQVNSDAIDFIDLYDIMNNSSDYTSEYGYLVRDLNGDGSVDFLDIYDFVMPNYDSGIYFYFPE